LNLGWPAGVKIFERAADLFPDDARATRQRSARRRRSYIGAATAFFMCAGALARRPSRRRDRNRKKDGRENELSSFRGAPMAYRIQAGDTLSKLAQRFHTTASALARADGIRNANRIYAGRSLNIPGSKDSFTPAKKGGGAAPVSNAPVKGNVGQWIAQAQAILRAKGVPASKMNAQDIALIIRRESGGNPNAQNNWDSNAKKGTPSIGLMQTIGPTFNAYKLPGHGNIRNPVDNIIAGVRYAIARYGSISNVPGVRNVHNGRAYVGY
jgi:LysM repeat protein